ncbi:MAG: hypothetical protein A2577_01440 [Bdellovibrionales bacterium RIFOXYD1_FULL_36_51]|nr:MAG: hypothetical protein A2181_03760 [Bdellovibrionales bacterium RIFOXYA1_FULL_38_20]OFZ51044.1 MAG: hypothetical protein A2417_19910 [Bdellovibrionales bacterium RIFOXYC1_FULL_37_79]OFZ63251.1 MAG: hypothetical protein A2577_01440 [Bdellovibrionales bacterium RIFOXYD1_FULL_36_51]
MPPVELPRNLFEGFFTITTCQRTLIVGLEDIKYPLGPNVIHIKGSEAYGYLLETITGLKSQVLAENEIVCQFKHAFKSYLESSKRDGRLITILEKLFKDNKDIRSFYLKNIGQQSYTGISKKILLHKSSYPEVLILGSGTLAQALIKLLSKKFKIFLSARNLQKVDELTRQFNFQQIPWPMIDEFKKVPNILSTIGAYKTYFDESFFMDWKNLHHTKGIFIDLGSPSTIQTNLMINDGVYRLFNIFNECKALSQEKELQIINAKNAIKNIVDKRMKYFDEALLNHNKDILLGI